MKPDTIIFMLICGWTHGSRAAFRLVVGATEITTSSWDASVYIDWRFTMRECTPVSGLCFASGTPTRNLLGFCHATKRCNIQHFPAVLFVFEYLRACRLHKRLPQIWPV